MKSVHLGGAERVIHKRPLGGFLMTRPWARVDNHMTSDDTAQRGSDHTWKHSSEERRSLTE